MYFIMKMFYFFGKESKYQTFTWWENFMSGHFTVKFPFKSHITFYGENQMHWAVNWKLLGTYVCFRLPFRTFGKFQPLYFYLSKDATPTKASFKLGRC
jgi:hypothetical protein